MGPLSHFSKHNRKAVPAGAQFIAQPATLNHRCWAPLWKILPMAQPPRLDFARSFTQDNPNSAKA